MAYFRWPKPDDVRCAEACAHTDCAEWRETLKRPCRLCGKEFKEQDAVQGPVNELVHLTCNVALVERERKAALR